MVNDPVQISTRPAAPADVDFAHCAHHAAYRDVVTRQFGVWNEAAQDSFFAKDWSLTGHEILLCNGERCGYVSLERSARHLHVRELVILPAYQGRGIGTAFLKGLQKEARARAVPVRLGVLQKNRAAALYRRLGFVEYEQTATHYLMEWRPEADPPQG